MSDYPLDSPQEPLSWEQKQTGYDEGITDDAGLEIDPAFSFPWPEDPDERTIVPIKMSLNEYTALLSAVDVGAAIAWTNEALRVYYILTRSLQVPPMTFCAQMIECINEDEDTKEALRNELLGDPEFMREMQEQIYRGNPVSPAQITTPLGATCDRDELWAGLLGMIQQMDRNNGDFLEQVEIISNPVERLVTVTGLIPPLQFASSVFDFVQTLFEDIAENYDAEYTSTYENEVTCQLFCMALDHEDCALSFGDIYDVFRERLEASFTIESVFDDVIQFLATGTWSGTQVCDFMFMLQLQVIRSAQKFLTIDLLSLQQMFTVGAGDPDGGWETLCVDCPEPGDNCFASAFEDPQAHYGVITSQTTAHIDITPSSTAIPGYWIAFGTMPSGEWCHFGHYEILTGTFTPGGGNPDGFAASKYPSGTEEDITATNYDITSFTYISTTAFTIRVYIGAS